MFNVTVTVKSPTSAPVDIRYYRGENHAEALAAMVQAAARDITDYEMPESIRTRVLSVRLDIGDDARPLVIGDRVQRIADRSAGTVIAVEPEGVSVRLDDDDDDGFPIDVFGYESAFARL